ncbi:MAG: hypothetical protein E6H93_00050 [Chloroflexi bacterium]|nr:MAG: hypothetical protein E6H93_00050 [Chloroflexota bacterium]
MALFDELALARQTAELVAVDVDVAANRVGAAGEALPLLDRVDRGEPVDDRQALDQRDRSGPQPDQAI